MTSTAPGVRSIDTLASTVSGVMRRCPVTTIEGSTRSSAWAADARQMIAVLVARIRVRAVTPPGKPNTPFCRRHQTTEASQLRLLKPHHMSPLPDPSVLTPDDSYTQTH